MKTSVETRPGLVTLPEPIAFDDDAALIESVTALRDWLESAKRVMWTAASDIPPALADVLEHLPPPREGGGPGGDLWRARHAYGALYYRVGPGFITVRERRSRRDAAVFTLSGPALSCWERLREPTTHRCDACAALDDEGLVLRHGGLRVMLPFRLRFPPTPFLAI